MFIIKSIIKTIIYFLLLFFYYPLYLAGLAVIRMNLSWNRFKMKTGVLRINNATMKLLSRRGKVSDVGCISTKEEIEFLNHRSRAYLERMTFWTAKELSKLFTGEQKVPLISDSQLCYVLLNSVFAHSLTWDDSKLMYCLDFSVMEKYILYEGFYWEAQKVYFDPNSCKIIIVLNDKKEYHSDCLVSNKANYNQAKLHVQVCMSYYAPGLGHSQTHFLFPSAICLAAKKILNPNSFLFQLLSPHFQFMERINYQAFREGYASSNTRTFFDRYFCFWKTFPITNEQFKSTMENSLENHYFDRKNDPNYLSKSNFSGDSVSANGLLHQHDCNLTREHPHFPPAYLTDDALQKIPYLAFLKLYYCVIRKFVKEVLPLIDRQEWLKLSQNVSRYVPGFDEVNMCDGIASFIHLVSVVHSADHESYFRYFAQQYGCMCVRTPFEPFSNLKFWKEVSRSKRLSIERIKKNPHELLLQRDIMRMRCFMNVFVDFVPTTTYDLSLVKTVYQFKDPNAEIAARRFISELRALDGNLKVQLPVHHFPQKKQERRGKGMQLVQLKNLIRSNCY